MKTTVEVIELPESDQTADCSGKPLNFDDILKEIGEFGRYQKLIAVLISIVSAFGTFIILSFVFSSAIPEHR